MCSVLTSAPHRLPDPSTLSMCPEVFWGNEVCLYGVPWGLEIPLSGDLSYGSGGYLTGKNVGQYPGETKTYSDTVGSSGNMSGTLVSGDYTTPTRTPVGTFRKFQGPQSKGWTLNPSGRTITPLPAYKVRCPDSSLLVCRDQCSYPSPTTLGNSAPQKRYSGGG